MKVCVIGLRGFPDVQGGVEKHCEALYTHFKNSNIQFIIFRRAPYVQRLNAIYSNIHFMDLPSTKIKGLEPVLHSFLSTIRILFCKPDIIHIHNIGPALFSPIFKLLKIPIVVTYHSPNYEHAKWNKCAKKILKCCELITFKMADTVIFVNKFQLHKMPDKYKHKAIYIPNGIDDDISITEKHDRIDSLGLEPGKYALAIGRITPEKGFDILAKAFARTMDKNFKLCIAGGVETEKDYYLELLKIAPDRIIFPGFVKGDTIKQLYSNARFFVLSSRNEGCPLALLDAMAYKRKLLVSDIPASHLISLPDDNYYPVDNIEQLKQKLEQVIAEPYSIIEYDMSLYNWNTIASKVDGLYRKIDIISKK